MYKNLHYAPGIILSIFIGLHLFNHATSIFRAQAHIEMMDNLRLFYRNIFVETILLMAVLAQIVSGWKLFQRSRKTAVSFFEKLHVWTGLYLAFSFFSI